MPKLPDTAHREQILDAAAQLFGERGFAGTSIQHIAAALGVTRTAVYYYFKNKEEILRSLVEEISVGATQRLGRPAPEKSTAAERLRKAVQEYALLILAHPRHFRVLDRSESDLPPDLARVHRQAKRQLLEAFSRAVSDGVALGEFRDVDPRMAAFAILGMCNWTSAWYLPEGRLTDQQIAAAMADFALHAVRANGRDAARDATRPELLDRALADLALLRRMID